jgi:hypothetical protein
MRRSEGMLTVTNETSICLTTLTAPLRFRIFRHCGGGCAGSKAQGESEQQVRLFASMRSVVQDPDNGM